MTPKFEDAVAIIVKAWEGRKDAPDYPDYDDINTAIGSLEKAVKILGILKGLLFIARDNNYGLSYLGVDQINEQHENFKTIKEWLEEKK